MMKKLDIFICSTLLSVALFSCSSVIVENDPMDSSKLVSSEFVLKTAQGRLGNHYFQIKRKIYKDNKVSNKFNMKFYGYYKEKVVKDFIEISLDDVIVKLPLEIKENFVSANGVENLSPDAAASYNERKLWYTIKFTSDIPANIADGIKNAKKILLRLHYVDAKGEDSSTFMFSDEQIKELVEILNYQYSS